MTLNRTFFALAIGSMLATVAFAASPGSQQASGEQEMGPVYSVEGAWYGMTNNPGIPSTPTMDTFVSNAHRSGGEGSFLCTIPAAMAGNQTPSAHGTWTRTGINTYAYTAMRAITSGATARATRSTCRR